jgi:hypothetical protein
MNTDGTKPFDMRSALRSGLLLLTLSLQIPEYSFAYNEPDNFAGLRFGQDLTKQMQQCPYVSLGSGAKSPDGKKIRASGVRCYHRGGDVYALWNMGELEHQFDMIDAQQIDGKLEYIYLAFRTNKFPTVFSLLQQRYGTPTQESRRSLTSKQRRSITSKHVVWKGRNVSITLDEVDPSDPDWILGTVNYETKAWSSRRGRKTK